MKSFAQIMAMLGAMAKHSLFPVSEMFGGGRKRKLAKTKHHKAKPNPFRRAHKPLMAGWPHQYAPIGSKPAPTLDEVRAVETMLKCKIQVINGFMHMRVKDGHTVIGEPNDKPTQIVEKFLKLVGQLEDSTIHVLPGEDFRASILEKYRIPFKDMRLV
jgi:hypothetical protein